MISDYKFPSLKEIEKKYSRSFNNKELIEILISKASDNKEAFDDLIFTGKYITGLFRAVSKNQYSNPNILNKEILESIEKVKLILKFILEGEFRRYEEIFFNSEMDSLIKLNSLSSDLELLKPYTNDLKQKS